MAVTTTTIDVSETWNNHISLVGTGENKELLKELERLRLETELSLRLKIGIEQLFDHAGSKSDWSTSSVESSALLHRPCHGGLSSTLARMVSMSVPVIASRRGWARGECLFRACSVVLLVD